MNDPLGSLAVKAGFAIGKAITKKEKAGKSSIQNKGKSRGHSQSQSNGIVNINVHIHNHND